MKNRYILLCMFFVLQASCLFAKTDLKAIFEGMGTTFGAAPVGYKYSFEVWNDASVPIYVEQEGMASFMGAYFPSVKGFYGKKTMPSIFDAQGVISKAVYSNENYYFKFYISSKKNTAKHPTKNPHTNPIYKQSLTQLPVEKNDPNVFYYHVYTAREFSQGRTVHKPAVEMMGFQNPAELDNPTSKKQGDVKFSDQLSQLAFYNSSATDVQVSLTYGTDPYTFTLEKYSYNALGLPTRQEKPDEKKKDDQADRPMFSLRPNTLTFTKYNDATQTYEQFRSFKLPPTGFADTSYTIEVFQDAGKPLEVGIQGFTIGNYDLPVTPRVRDVTPCPCTFWHQSFQQAGSVPGYSNLPGQVWVVYGGIDSPVQSKVIPGQVVSWNLVRPLISQADQFVYFIYVVTDDDTVAQNFVKKVVAQVIGQDTINKYIKVVNTPAITQAATKKGLDVTGQVENIEKSLTADQQTAALMGSLSVTDGIIEDVEQNIIGYLLGTDVFTPKGLGFGRFYYTLAPSVVSLNGIVSLLSSCLDSAKIKKLGSSDTDIQKSLTAKVTNWFAVYMKQPADVKMQVEKYLLEYGNAKIVDAKTGKLTKFGQNRLQTIVTGKMSLKYPSMKLSTVTNQYVYDFGKAAPEKMPDALKNISSLYNSNVQKKQDVKTTVKQRLVAVAGTSGPVGYIAANVAADVAINAVTDKKS